MQFGCYGAPPNLPADVKEFHVEIILFTIKPSLIASHNKQHHTLDTLE